MVASAQLSTQAFTVLILHLVFLQIHWQSPSGRLTFPGREFWPSAHFNFQLSIMVPKICLVFLGGHLLMHIINRWSYEHSFGSDFLGCRIRITGPKLPHKFVASHLIDQN